MIDPQPIEYYDAIPHFWDDCDRAEDWLNRHPGKLHNASTIKRGAKILGDVYRVLGYLDRHQYVAADGNGCWRKYAARQHLPASTYE